MGEILKIQESLVIFVNLFVYCIRVMTVQIDLAVTFTILDLFSTYDVEGRPKKYRARSYRFFEKNFVLNITQNSSKN